MTLFIELAHKKLSEKGNYLDYLLDTIKDELDKVSWEFFKVGNYFPSYLNILKDFLKESSEKLESYIKEWEDS